MDKIDFILRTTLRHLSLLARWLRNVPTHNNYSDRAESSFLRRILEQYVLLVKNGITVEDYYEFNLHKADRPWAEKREYIGQLDYDRLYRHINGMAYDAQFRNKLVFQLLCESLHIPVVPILAVYTQKAGVYPRRALRNRQDLESFLKEGPCEHIFMKNSTQSFGIGSMSLGEYCGNDTWKTVPTAQEITITEISNHLAHSDQRGGDPQWLIQDTVSAHSDLTRVVAGVCPTLRIMTLQLDDNVIVTDALLRFGYGDSPVDNNRSGGVPFLVDTITGEVGQGAWFNEGRWSTVTSHPATGEAVTGMQVPFWEQARDLAIESAEKFSQMTLIGWDIAVTENGPVVLEANSCARLMGLQLLRSNGLLAGPLRKVLKMQQGVERSGITLAKD